jgi:hypothetical protein
LDDTIEGRITISNAMEHQTGQNNNFRLPMLFLYGAIAILIGISAAWAWFDALSFHKHPLQYLRPSPWPRQP